MLKNKSYIGIAFIVLVFGIIFVPKIIDRVQNGEVVKGDRLDKVSNHATENSSLNTIGKAPKFELSDQNNKPISNKDYLGKVYVLEFPHRRYKKYIFWNFHMVIVLQINNFYLYILKLNGNFSQVSHTSTSFAR